VTPISRLLDALCGSPGRFPFLSQPPLRFEIENSVGDSHLDVVCLGRVLG